jgi:hypothetical protein
MSNSSLPPIVRALDAALNRRVIDARSDDELNAALFDKAAIKRFILVLPDEEIPQAARVILQHLEAPDAT